MKFLVLALAIVAALAEPEETVDLEWLNESLYGANQDAWKSLQADDGSVYYLAWSTYNDDETWGTDITCLSVTGMNVNEEEKSIDAVISFKSNGEDAYQVSYEKVYAVTTEGYEKENAIMYVTEDGQTYTDVLVYSDGNSCDVFYVPPKDGYELWAKNPSEIAENCQSVFEKYTAGRNVLDVFKSDCQ
ncbi:female-specific histamine-binding protein 2 [Rhipicephalus sanguineus]|uniref:female-specific histamine-binding protein 2 n=1 Tax=Rhipicephalus sanguineus TaxID=34632 RepID=UPI0018944473|nr:female-specific histamine-binding protein 2 [Rhipicephalus sanguineus]